MPSSSLKLLLSIAGAVLFNIIFWNEKLALNSLLFDGFILCSTFYLYPTSIKKPAVKYLLLAHLITVTTVVVHNTILSKLAFSATLLLLIIFVQYIHRSVWFASGSILMNYIFMIPNYWALIKHTSPQKNRWKTVRKIVRFVIIPILLLFVFMLLYNLANSIFSQMINEAATAMSKIFAHFFDVISWQRLGFLLIGFFLTGGLLLKSSISYFSDEDQKKNDNLKRIKNNLLQWKKTHWFELINFLMGRFANGVMALRNENSTGIISLAMLNALLLFINCIDMVYVWFGFSYTGTINLSKYVHEGAGLLIFSIVLAMLLLLFFFRGNLNFYKKNKWLKQLAFLWILQNIVLVISVLLRDWYYIQHYGLAYKRIGVLIFLLMVLTGLFTVFMKIQLNKTSYFLMRVNGWFAIILLVLTSCIHWDETIASYNLSQKDHIELDVKFLLSLSDKTLPLLEKNLDVLSPKKATISDGEGAYLYRGSLNYSQVFEQRKIDFFMAMKNYSWLSWNLADEYVKKQLMTSKPALPLSINK